MSNPTEENIATVMNGLEEYCEHMLKTNDFSIREFYDFMESKFKAAGYREEFKPDPYDDSRGGRILILTDIGAGDFVVATGAIREIRRVYPDARITMVVHPRAFELAETCPYVDEIILNPQKYPSDNLFGFYKSNMEVAKSLLKQRFDICFSLSNNPHNPLLMYMNGARVRIIPIDDESMEAFNQRGGLIRYLMRLATHIFPYNAYGYNKADRFHSLLENMLHLPITNRKLELWLTSDDVEFAQTQLKNLPAAIYGLGMGCATAEVNHYPPEKYAQLTELILREEPEATFVILGGGQDDLNSAEIFKATLPEVYHTNILDLTNKTTYRQSAAILSLCNLHICNDTGTMHVAAAVGCPVLNPIPYSADLPMFTVSCPSRWYPYGVPSVRVQPAHALPECKEHPGYRGCNAKEPHCIAQIEPETLFEGFHLLKEMIAAKANKTIYVF